MGMLGNPAKQARSPQPTTRAQPNPHVPRIEANATGIEASLLQTSCTGVSSDK